MFPAPVTASQAGPRCNAPPQRLRFGRNKHPQLKGSDQPPSGGTVTQHEKHVSVQRLGKTAQFKLI